MNHPTPTSPLVGAHNCHHLRHKGMYVLSVPEPTQFHDPYDARPIISIHDAPEQRRRRVVEMHDRARSAAQRLERAKDQLLARLRQHLDRDVVGNEIFIDQLAAHSVTGRAALPDEIEMRDAGNFETCP